MTDLIIIAVLAVIIVVAVRYLYKAKKNGSVCVGCPSGGCGCCNRNHSEGTGRDCDGSCSCH